jgi:hypothetical protein
MAAQRNDVDSGTKVVQGTTVFDANGEKMGKVLMAGEDFILIEKGIAFPDHFKVPTSVIASFNGEEAHLGVGKDEAVALGDQMVDPALPGSDESHRQDWAAAALTGTDPAAGERVTQTNPTARATANTPAPPSAVTAEQAADPWAATGGGAASGGTGTGRVVEEGEASVRRVPVDARVTRRGSGA